MPLEPINFGGRTVEKPCTGAFGGCGWDDFDIVRTTFRLEHNALVRSMNAYNDQVGLGKMSWDHPLAKAADAVYQDSFKLDNSVPTTMVGWWLQGSVANFSAGAIAEMIQQAGYDRAAATELDQLLGAAGVPVPQKPLPPPPEQTVGQEFFQGAKDIAKGVGVLVGVGIVAVLAYGWATRSSSSSGGPSGGG